ncbi:MAG: selenium-dependent molybdenum cofactor biosynthesis protein YqeB [Vicinamibacteria bacterium]
MSPLVVFRGGGEMASAAARLVFLAGFRVVVLERAAPLALRRLVAFAEAVFAGSCQVEGVPGRRVAIEALAAAGPDAVRVAVDPEASCLAALAPDVVVDGRMAKRNLGTRRTDAPLVIGLGPGLSAGTDVHAVVETQRGPDLGSVRWHGETEADTGVPAAVLGHTAARVLRAPVAGTLVARRAIGDLVGAGETVARVGGADVVAEIAGMLRGIVADGVAVEAAVKIGDIDPRGLLVDPARVSEKGRAIAAGVLEAIFRAPTVLKAP